MVLAISIFFILGSLFLFVLALGISHASSLADDLLGRFPQSQHFPDLLDGERS